MSSVYVPIADLQDGDPVSHREVMRWIWPAGTRMVLAIVVLAAGLGLAGASRSLPRSAAEIVPAPDLCLDVNTVPSHVLGTLPHVGQALVRQLVAARDIRPIASLDDAGSRVRGLGPVTLAQIAPYLRFAPAAQVSLDDSAGTLVDQPVAKTKGKRAKTSPRSRKRKSAPVQPRLVSRASEPGTL